MALSVQPAEHLEDFVFEFLLKTNSVVTNFYIVVNHVVSFNLFGCNFNYWWLFCFAVFQ